MFEKLIETLAALVAAITANTAALKGAAAPATPKADKLKPETPAGPTAADVKAAAVANIEAHGNDNTFVKALCAKYGVKKASEAPVDKLGEILAILKTDTEAAKKTPPATADDVV